jgi:hypothetical protein
MTNDYQELNLYIQDMEEDTSVDLYVYFDHHEMYVFKDITSNPIRYQGFWSVDHKFFGDIVATAQIEDSKVKFFKVIENRKRTDSL